MQNEIRYIDLFAGVGGFRLGIERTSNSSTTKRDEFWWNEEGSSRNKSISMVTQQFTCVFTSEIDKYAIQTYNKNFKTEIKPNDITT